MMKFGIEVFWLYEVEEIIEKGILLLIGVGVLGRIFLSMEEFYEMKLVMKFVEEGCDVIEEVYFVILYLISFEGQVYIEFKIIQFNLIGLSEYMEEYVNRIEFVSMGGLFIFVEFKVGNVMIQKYFFWVFVDIVEREFWKGVNGDGEMLVYIFVKDLYRVINSGRRELIRDVVFRLFCQGRVFLEGSGRVSGEFWKVMKIFMWQEYLEVFF